MSTTRRRPRATHAALALAFALALGTTPSGATPPFVAAARLLPARTQQRLLGGTVVAQALSIQPDGSVTFGTVALASLDGDSAVEEHGRLSVGSRCFPLLNRSVQAMGGLDARNTYHLTGTGVAVGVVDTGLDVRHADFRNADGTTRVAWLLDYSRPVRGLHPELESRFGFVHDDGITYGAAFSAADLDALLSAETASGVRDASIPEDEVGHGTHVASIAAGNGRATGNGLVAGRYIGVAPDATLIIVRAAAQGEGSFTDAAVVAGATFVADRATALGLPVAINLSLGSQGGTHDGNSPLERGLTALVPPGTPGRAIVVAAGNQGADAGQHTRVDMFERATNEIPVQVDAGGADDVLLIDVVYEGTADIALQFPGGVSTPWVFEGQARGYAASDGLVSIANATDGYVDVPGHESLSPGARVRAATVLITADEETHTERRAGTFKILVRGSGIAHAYINESDGSAGPGGRFVGALEYGSVAVPATSPGLLSVGATVTRVAWETADHMVVRDTTAQLGTVALFSARGPNRVNEPRPDVLAPGQYIIAALSAQAPPSESLSVFHAGDSCGQCLIADDGVHAVAQGTSAAAPHVTGAAALLFQLRPTATQDELRSVLADTAVGVTGGAPRWNLAEGWGSIRVDAAAAKWMGSGAVPASPSAAHSDVTVTVPRVAPNEPATVTVRLADETGATLSGEHTVSVRASQGVVQSVTALGEGRYAARWRATGMAPGDRALFTAMADGVTLDTEPGISVARDVLGGDATGSVSGGGCNARGARGGSAAWSAGVVMLALGALRRVRRGRSGKRA